MHQVRSVSYRDVAGASKIERGRTIVHGPRGQLATATQTARHDYESCRAAE